MSMWRRIAVPLGILALGLLVFGFGYYLYNTAKRKGWFLTKAPYYTFIDRANNVAIELVEKDGQAYIIRVTTPDQVGGN